MSELDWERPAQIPTIAEPRALPPGSGTLLLNDIASRAQRAGVQILRYAGPYPSHALFSSLLRSFTTTGTIEQFTADMLDRAMRVARDEVPIDFAPAPFVRSATPHGFTDVRDGVLDRVKLGDVLYDREEQTGSLALLNPGRAILTVGPAPIALIAKIDEHHQVVDGPHPIPSFPAEVLGKAFIPELVKAVAVSSAYFTIPPLMKDVEKKLASSRIVWADLGWRAARQTADGFEIHVGFMVLTNPLWIAQFAKRISYHLAMTAQSAVLDELLASRR